MFVTKLMTLQQLKSLKDEMMDYSRKIVRAESSAEELCSLSAKEAQARKVFESAQQTYLKQFSIVTRYAARDEMTRVLYYSS